MVLMQYLTCVCLCFVVVFFLVRELRAFCQIFKGIYDPHHLPIFRTMRKKSQLWITILDLSGLNYILERVCTKP